MSKEISIEKIISDIKQTKSRKHCEGLHLTLSSDGYVRSVVGWTRVTKPSRIDALVAEVEKLRAERDASLNAERVWEKTMMEVCGEDGPASVASEIRSLKALRDTAMQALKSQVEQLAAENVALKAGASYFSYGSEHNFEWHKTAEEAVEAAEAAIDDYRGDACDGWSEEVDSICWGIIMQSSTKVGERPRNEDDRCDPAIDTVCDYALLPNIETPATDRIVAEAEARGVEKAIAHLENKFSNIGVQIMNLQWLADSLREGADK